MPRPAIEVADILRGLGPALRDGLCHDQHKAVNAILACRTAGLGGHVTRCEDCAAMEVAYNSCRNRHCPKCQSAASHDWLEARRQDLLPVAYYHVVFTLPAPLARVAFQNKRVVYDALFKAVSETLLTIGADPKHLGAKLGATLVLHTWGSAMTHHPHIHGIVPGGGLSPDGTRWIDCRRNFFLPVRVLSRLFRRLIPICADEDSSAVTAQERRRAVALARRCEDRFRSMQLGIMCERLSGLQAAGKLSFHGDLAHLADPKAFASFLKQERRRDWVVYAKRPFAGPEQVLSYLARYTHRIAISNSRITAYDGQRVTFRVKDYRKQGEARYEVMTLAAAEFARRFLQHVLPDGLHRIRDVGLLANTQRRTLIARARELLADRIPPQPPEPEATSETEAPAPGPAPCASCGGRMILIELIIPASRLRKRPAPKGIDSS